MRLQRALALGGIDSRRKCEEHIVNGAVMVNGEVVTELGRQVDPESDVICFRGRALDFAGHIYYILHKPRGYTTTAADPYAEKTVYELLPRKLVSSTRRPDSGRRRVFPVGRLDRDSTGLLLFTSDGELANRLIHPRYGVGKWYEVRLNRLFEHVDKERLFQGIRLSDGLARVQKIQSLTRRVIRVLICEGKKREIRRIFEALGYFVVELTRLTMGVLVLGDLPSGLGRFLSKEEVINLKKAVSYPEGAAKKTLPPSDSEDDF